MVMFKNLREKIENLESEKTKLLAEVTKLRKEAEGKAISASTVRKLIQEGEIEQVKELVPATTYEFLVSEREEAKKIIKLLKNSEGRH